jgi:2-polyprenyl-6-methoxyphenol hydroxylase-like FAD-dependent oxidoreductase
VKNGGRIPLIEPVSPLSPAPSFHCPQTLTEKVLFDMLGRTSPDCVRFNQKVTAVTVQEKQVKFSVGGERWTAEWLIAADGAGGQIRRDLQVESDGPGEMGRFLNVFFKADYSKHLAGRRSLLFSVLSEKRAEFFVTVNGDNTSG